MWYPRSTRVRQLLGRGLGGGLGGERRRLAGGVRLLEAHLPLELGAALLLRGHRVLSLLGPGLLSKNVDTKALGLPSLSLSLESKGSNNAAVPLEPTPTRTKNYQGGFVYAGWCGDGACEAQIKEDTKATIRCLPDEEFRSAEAPTSCLKCGRAATVEALWARAY